VISLDWTYAHHERGPKIWGVKKAWDHVEQRLAPYQTVVTAVIANRARLDGIEVLVQQPNRQDEELAYLQETVRDTYLQLEEARGRVLELLHHLVHRLGYKPMVLVSYIPDSHVSILQTKFSDREGHEARRVGLEAMPLGQDIEGGHGEREPGVEIRPGPVHDLFEVADERQHGQDRLHEDAIFPLAALTEFEVGGIAFRGMKGRITQDNHLFFKLPNEPLKGVIRDIGRGTVPSHDQPLSATAWKSTKAGKVKMWHFSGIKFAVGLA